MAQIFLNLVFKKNKQQQEKEKTEISLQDDFEKKRILVFLENWF